MQQGGRNFQFLPPKGMIVDEEVTSFFGSSRKAIDSYPGSSPEVNLRPVRGYAAGCLYVFWIIIALAPF